MKSAVAKRIKAEVERFCRVRGKVGFENQLYKLAVKSYNNLPAKERQHWSLKAIVDQGL